MRSLGLLGRGCVVGAGLGLLLLTSGCGTIPPPKAHLVEAGVGRMEIYVECVSLGDPLRATISIAETNVTTVTDQNGQAGLELPGGHWYHVLAKSECHAEEKVTLWLETGQIKFIKLRLREEGCIKN